MSRSTTEVFEDHLFKRLKGDTDGDISENYSESVIVLTGTGAFHGHEGIRRSADELAALLKKNAVFEYRHTLIEGDYAFLEWTATSEENDVYDGADSFVIHEGKIVFQSIHYTTDKTRI